MFHRPPAWAGPGSYVLILNLSEARTCRIGALGTHELPAGYYLYVGSALGPGGLAGRVGRHLRRKVGAYCIRPLRWHIDYLLEIAEVVEVWAAPGAERLECVWARRLLEEGGRVVVPGFGSSDCRCRAHLIYFEDLKTCDVLQTSQVLMPRTTFAPAASSLAMDVTLQA